MSIPDADFDRRMMALALEAARKGSPSPNPHVGAVVVRDGKVLAVGHHERAGTAHAEVAALRQLDHRAPGATMYVTLEPCSHHGRTSPCCEALVAAGVRRVVIGCEDPIAAHAGGAQRLRQAGVEVEMGCLRTEAELLIADFRKHACTGLPYLVLDAPLAQPDPSLPRAGDVVPYDGVLLQPGLPEPTVPHAPRSEPLPSAPLADLPAFTTALRKLAACDHVRVLVRCDAATGEALVAAGLIDAIRSPSSSA